MKYIAMEYIHGETVADIVKRGLAVEQLPAARARGPHRPPDGGRAWPTRTSAASADGHVLRIVHRDVSPTNILVSYEGQTKIVDFGIARAQDELREESGTRPGKASYMSPEQVRGEPADYRSDIFSLGIILYELTLCQRLYRGAPEVMMRKIVDGAVTPPTAINRDYPPTLELIVMRALEKRPEDRYQSAEEMSHDLEEFLEESGLRSGNRRVVALHAGAVRARRGDVGRGRRGVARVRRTAAAGVRRPAARCAGDELGRAGSRSPRAARDAHRGGPRAGRARGARAARPDPESGAGAGRPRRRPARAPARLGRRRLEPVAPVRPATPNRNIVDDHQTRPMAGWVIDRGAASRLASPRW